MIEDGECRRRHNHTLSEFFFFESRTSLRSLNQEEVDRACGANGEVAAFQAGTVGQVLRRQGRPRLTGEGGNAPPRFVRPRK